MVLVAEAEELQMEKLPKWKNCMEFKGLRVNIGKTKVHEVSGENSARLRIRDSIHVACESKVFLDNSIKCVACHKWVHKRCSGISGRLGYVADFHCRRSLDWRLCSGSVVK